MSSASPFLVLLVLLYACGSTPKKSPRANGNNDTTSAINTAKKDTMPIPTPPGPGLPPGQAKIKGEIKEVKTSGKVKNDLFSIRIIEVIEYGPSTPPLVTGDTLWVNAPNLADNYGPKFAKNDTTTLIIQQNLSAEPSNHPSWSMVKLEN